MGNSWAIGVVVVAWLVMLAVIWYRPTVVQVPAPIVHVEAPKVHVDTFVKPDRVPEPVVIRLVDERENELGVVRTSERRRPQIEARGVDGLLGTFSASHQVGDEWVYRRVGVARES